MGRFFNNLGLIVLKILFEIFIKSKLRNFFECCVERKYRVVIWNVFIICIFLEWFNVILLRYLYCNKLCVWVVSINFKYRLERDGIWVKNLYKIRIVVIGSKEVECNVVGIISSWEENSRGKWVLFCFLRLLSIIWFEVEREMVMILWINGLGKL